MRECAEFPGEVMTSWVLLVELFFRLLYGRDHDWLEERNVRWSWRDLMRLTFRDSEPRPSRFGKN